MGFKPITIEGARVIAEDLEWLQQLANDPGTPDRELRRASVELRKFFVDGVLLRAWTTVVGKETFHIQARNIRPLIDRDAACIEFASFSTHVRPMGEIGEVSVGCRNSEGKFVRPEPTPGPTLPLKAFMQGTACIVHGKKLSRIDMVKALANKKGGAHIDESRDGGTDELVDVLEGYVVMEASALFAEIHTMIRCLMSSDDTRRLELGLIRYLGL